MKFYLGPQDVVGMVQRRFFWGAIPFLLMLIAAMIMIDRIPPQYESRARLIVEDQQIRNDLVASAVTSDARARIEAVAARVTARDNMQLMVEQLNTFAGMGLTGPERAEMMQAHSSVQIERIRATGGGRNTTNAITATISYRSRSPAEAQRVANALMTEFQARHIELRSEQAQGQTLFLSAEEDKIRRALERTFADIARVKADSAQSLPENRDLYERSLDRAVADVARFETSIEQAQQELRLVQMQRPLVVDADSSQSADERALKAKRRELASLRRAYQDTYPDVIRLKEEVLALERDVDPSAYRQNARAEINALTAQIAAASEAEAAPLISRREELRASLQSLPGTGNTTTLSELQFEAQVAVLQSRIDTLTRQRDDATARITDFETRLAAIPAVAGQLYRLEQEQAQLEAEILELRRKRGVAERAQSLEEQSKAERLAVLENPIRPEQPVAPDKPKLAALAGIGAMGIAAIFALFPEVFAAKVRSARHIQAMFPNAKVVEVPRYRGAQSRLPQLITYGVLFAVTGALVLAAAAVAVRTVV